MWQRGRHPGHVDLGIGDHRAAPAHRKQDLLQPPRAGYGLVWSGTRRKRGVCDGLGPVGLVQGTLAAVKTRCLFALVGGFGHSSQGWSWCMPSCLLAWGHS